MRAKAIARKGEFEFADKLGREAVAFGAESDFLNDRADALVDGFRPALRPLGADLADA